MSHRREEVENELLVLQAQCCNEAAMGELVRRWQARFLAHAKRLTGDAHSAEEAVQESWLAVVRGIAKLQQPAAFGIWAYRIVGRECADSIRRKQRERRNFNGTARAAVAPSESDGVQQALNKLSVEHREALVLHYLQGMGVAEIAEAIGVRVGTVKSRLHYAREAMRRAMGE